MSGKLCPLAFVNKHAVCLCATVCGGDMHCTPCPFDANASIAKAAERGLNILNVFLNFAVGKSVNEFDKNS